MIRSTPPGRRGNATESPALIRELYNALLEELSAIVGYSYADTLLEAELPFVAELFEEIGMDEMRHYHTLAALLRDLGAPFTPRTVVLPAPQAPTGDATTDARRILSASERDERGAHRSYLRLAAMASTPRVADTLRAIAADEEEHAMAHAAMQHRLRDS